MSTVLPFPTSSIIVNSRKRGTNAARVKTLADSIQQLGLLNPITVTFEGVLVAGLHRLEAALVLGWEEIPAHVVALDALQAELAEIDENLIRNELSELEQCTQLARRKEIYEALFPETKQGASGRRGSGNGETISKNDTVSFSEDSADKMSKSQRTVERKVKVGKALGDIAERLLDTPVADSQKALLALAQMDETEREEIVELLETGEAQTIGQARKILKEEAQNTIPDDMPKDISDRCLLICGDMQEVGYQIEDESVDVIITDPPYPKEYLPLYEELAILAARVLKPGGSLICMTGQSYLPELLALMTPHITYHWAVAYLTPGGQSPQIFPRKVNTFWKPVFWFVKGAYTGYWIGDVAKSEVNNNDKRFHHWGQSESGMADLMERFTLPGQTVLDPFMGGGTTGVVALAMNRRFIGIDTRLEAVETTYKRLQGVTYESAATD